MRVTLARPHQEAPPAIRPLADHLRIRSTSPTGGSEESRLLCSVLREEIYEVADVSFDKDGIVMKKLVKQGEGYDTAKDLAR